jgi:hypothetical protein
MCDKTPCNITNLVHDKYVMKAFQSTQKYAIKPKSEFFMFCAFVLLIRYVYLEMFVERNNVVEVLF